MNAVSRGASPAVVRAVFSDEPVAKESIVKCDMCGFPMDFTRRDWLGLGRTMQACTNRHCPERVTRPLPIRRPVS